MQSDTVIETAAQRLLAAYPPGAMIPVPEDLVLEGETQAYALQARVSAALGTPSGWKLGGIVMGEIPRYSRLFAERSQLSPARFSRGDFHRVYLEPELAVVMGEAVVPRDVPYRLEEIIPRVASLHAAIELVDSRFEAWPEVPPLWQLADGLSHGAFVLGAAALPGNLSQMRDAPYRLDLDGETVISGKGGHPGGDPARLLVEMINAHVRASGRGLDAGEVITTGTFNGVVAMRAGQEARLAFPGIGEALLRLDA